MATAPIQPYTALDTVGSIVAEFPGASNIFKKYGIDFCCGGNRALQTVFRQEGLNGEEVLLQLNEAHLAYHAAGMGDKDWRSATGKEIIEEVVNKHHAYLKSELPLLSEFTTKILRVHGPNHADSLEPLHRYFHEVKRELDEHLVKEETELFPLILRYEEEPSDELYAQASAKLEELEREHEHAGELVRKMREVTDNFTLPEGACRTYTLTFRKLVEFESDLFQHIHLENNILFPRFAGDCGCGHETK